MPRILMLIGLPGVGKSKWASDRFEPEQILSSDTYREKLLGDINDQSANVDVFDTLYRDIEQMFVDNEWPTIVFDATNIGMKYRKRVFEIADKHRAIVDAIVFVEPLDVILERNRSRDRVVPEDLIRKKYATFHVPVVTETWGNITYWRSMDGGYDFDAASFQAKPFDQIQFMCEWWNSRLSDMRGFDQHNPYHSLNLWDHTMRVVGHLRKHSADWKLLLAALYHDVGKLDTQTFGDDGIAHYYGHQCVSAQIAIQELRGKVQWQDLHYITSLIHYHMDVYNCKTAIDTAKLARRLNNPQLFTDLILLHEADVMAH